MGASDPRTDGQLLVATASDPEASARYVPRPEPARGWLYGIAWNKLHEAQRRGQAEETARRALGMGPIVLSDEAVERLEAIAGAGAMLEALPAEQRQAVRARVVDDRSYEEIAAELRCSPGVVRQRVSRGVRALRARLEATGDV